VSYQYGKEGEKERMDYLEFIARVTSIFQKRARSRSVTLASMLMLIGGKSASQRKARVSSSSLKRSVRRSFAVARRI